MIDNSGSYTEEEEDEMVVEAREIDPLCPVIPVTKKEIQEACKPWRKAIIIKLLGERVGLNFLTGRLARLWHPTGEMEVIDLDHDFFIVRFSNSTDYQHVFDGGPSIILGHCLVIQQWKPKFILSAGEIGKVAVWVRIPQLAIELYENHFLWRIGEHLGRIVRIDEHTLKMRQEALRMEKEGLSPAGTERGRFNIICVEVDLRKTLVAKFEMNGDNYKVEYEGLNQICFHCGRFGHRMDSCPMLTDISGGGGTQRSSPAITKHGKQAAQDAEPFGEWMLVKRNHRKGKPASGSKKVINVSNKSGSRFNALAGEGSPKFGKNQIIPIASQGEI